MRVIQSFAQFDEGSYYLKHDKDNGKKTYLNFYTMLLSVLTLQKYYGKVTMYCNQKAHDNFIKYLPYDEIKIVENKNDFTFWNYYKVDVIRKQTTKFIHVDPDVFIFGDLFTEFFKTRKYDIIIQDKIPDYHNPTTPEMKNVRAYLKEYDIMNPELCDGNAFSHGVVGMSVKVKNEFMKMADGFREAYINGQFKPRPDLISMISEELALYLVAQLNGYKFQEILQYDDVLRDGSRIKTNEKKYTHMWGDSKFKPEYIEIIKLKTKKDFPLYSDLIDQFDADVVKNKMT